MKQTVDQLKIKIFADGADLKSMLEMYKQPFIKGFTTNPTLMRKAGIANYEEFCRNVLEKIPDRPLSLEVFSDDIEEMARQAKEIAAWGGNVYVKIPVTDTHGETTSRIVRNLSAEGIKLNITAILTLEQVRSVTQALSDQTPAIVSVFAGRIADTGVDPVPLMREALQIVKAKPAVELLWASPREVLNIVQANDIGCHIITVTNDLIKKLTILGTKLSALSLQTVKMFYEDALAAGYRL